MEVIKVNGEWLLSEKKGKSFGKDVYKTQFIPFFYSEEKDFLIKFGKEKIKIPETLALKRMKFKVILEK